MYSQTGNPYGLGFTVEALNPKLEALNPKPQTVNLNPKLEALQKP